MKTIDHIKTVEIGSGDNAIRLRLNLDGDGMPLYVAPLSGDGIPLVNFPPEWWERIGAFVEETRARAERRVDTERDLCIEHGYHKRPAGAYQCPTCYPPPAAVADKAA